MLYARQAPVTWLRTAIAVVRSEIQYLSDGASWHPAPRFARVPVVSRRLLPSDTK